MILLNEQLVHKKINEVYFSHQPPQMSKREIEDLLRKGAYGAIMEEDDDANKYEMGGLLVSIFIDVFCLIDSVRRISIRFWSVGLM